MPDLAMRRPCCPHKRLRPCVTCLQGEAEVPALAMRRPVVLAASVEASAISATVVKALRDKTGAGMMDCKKALGACGGDAEKVRLVEGRG